MVPRNSVLHDSPNVKLSIPGTRYIVPRVFFAAHPFCIPVYVYLCVTTDSFVRELM